MNELDYISLLNFEIKNELASVISSGHNKHLYFVANTSGGTNRFLVEDKKNNLKKYFLFINDAVEYFNGI